MDDYLADDTDAWWGMLDNPETMLTLGSLGDFTPEQLNNFGFEVVGDQTGTGGYGITDDDGNTLVVTADGQKYLTDPSGKQISASDARYKTVAPGLLDKFTKALSTPAGMLTAGRALYGLLGGGDQPRAAGYEGKIPELTSVREQIKQPEYQPYTGRATMGRRFFTDQQYAAPKDADTARAAAQTQAQQMATQIPAAPAAAAAPNPNVTAPVAINKPVAASSNVTATGILQDFLAKQSAPASNITSAAQGGIMQAAKGRYLRGETDGMADKIPSSIDGVQPAALSHGEFVIPADVVSHLGNGNSDAGANQLYKMMDRVRKDRTGTTKQGKKINPDKYLGGGIADYASGGVAKFTTGGVSSSSSALAPSASNPYGSSATTTLAPYIGDYATGMLGRAQALAKSPYEAYTGPLTAGYSPLQQQAFTAAGNINPQATFGTSDLQQYMNPYTQLSLQPQLDELRRQAEISQQNIQGQFSKAGAFGGAREAIARSENLRNLQAAQSGIIGKGFENAFNQAMGQYNVGRQQQLSDLGALAGIGAQQRGIEQEGIAALQKQFEQEQADPYTKLRFQQSMMQGLPVGTTSITPNLSDMQRTGITLKQATDMYEILKNIPGFADAIKP